MRRINRGNNNPRSTLHEHLGENNIWGVIIKGGNYIRGLMVANKIYLKKY